MSDNEKKLRPATIEHFKEEFSEEYIEY
jgi:hypothetical protein